MPGRPPPLEAGIIVDVGGQVRLPGRIGEVRGERFVKQVSELFQQGVGKGVPVVVSPPASGDEKRDDPHTGGRIEYEP